MLIDYRFEIEHLCAILGTSLLRISTVGSRVTCYPAPKNTDADWLILVDDNFFPYGIGKLTSVGFELDDSGLHYLPQQSTFNSWRGCDELNLIITTNFTWHNKFLEATGEARRLNILDKKERIQLFQKKLYGATF